MDTDSRLRKDFAAGPDPTPDGDEAANVELDVYEVYEDIAITPQGLNDCSNDDLVRAVYRALDANAAIPKGAVFLAVYGRFVRLFGKVDWSYQRAAAINTVKKVAGVLGVQDEIRVQRDG